MLIYWLMFWFPFLGAITPRKMVGRQSTILFLVVCGVFTVIMGLRDQVGGDWYNYLPMFDYFSTEDLSGILEYADPGYALLNWVVAQLGGSMYTVNFICAALTMFGTYRFCQT